MSYSRQDGNGQRGSFAGRQWKPEGSATALLSNRGEASYVDDSRKVRDLIQRIQGYVADTQKETRLVSADAHSAGRGRAKIQEICKDVKNTTEEANRLLSGIAASGPASSVEEQHHRRTTQLKLSENLTEMTKALHLAISGFETAEATAAKQLAAAADVKSHVRSRDKSVELGAVDANEADIETGEQSNRLQEFDVSAAEVENHTAIVQEYAQEVSQLSQNINALQRCMVDLAEYAQEQGEVLDNIETNVSTAADSSAAGTEQLLVAEKKQQRGMKKVCCMLFTAATATLIVVALTVHF